MAKFEIKVSRSLEDDVLRRAEEIAAAGLSEAPANIQGISEKMNVYIDKEPKSFLLAFVGTGELTQGSTIYLGIDA